MEFKLQNIVIIEDDYDFAKMEMSIIQNEYDVDIKIAHQKEQIEELMYIHYDIFLLDLNLNGISGLDVIDMIRKETQNPIILITSQSELDSAITALKKGANEFLLKSPDLIEILPVVIKKVFHDYREKKKLQEEKVESDKLETRIETLGQVFATLSHHINNSTSSIFGLAQLCERDLSDNKNLKKLVEVSLRETKSITNVLKELEVLIKDMKFKTVDYMHLKDGMFEIDKEQ